MFTGISFSLLSIIPFTFRCFSALLAPQGNETNATRSGTNDSSRFFGGRRALVRRVSTSRVGKHRYPMQPFPDWLANRSQEPAQAENLATLIAGAGAAGVSRDRLRRLCGLPPETLADVLRALTATGQVEMLKVNGQLVYRATT
jgi:hypothetical protein